MGEGRGKSYGKRRSAPALPAQGHEQPGLAIACFVTFHFTSRSGERAERTRQGKTTERKNVHLATNNQTRVSTTKINHSKGCIVLYQEHARVGTIKR